MTFGSRDDISQLLAFTAEELKGKIRPAEVIVDEKTLIAASKVHNDAIVAVYDKLAKLQSDVDEIRTALDGRMNSIDAKLDKWSGRVEDLEKSHNDSVTEQEVINLEVNAFKLQTQQELVGSRRRLDDLAAVVQKLPDTIQIDCNQVRHTTKNSDGASISATLDFILDQQDTKNIEHENTLNDHVERIDMIDEHVSDEIVRVMNWVSEQKQNEMDAWDEKIKAIELDLDGKMSNFEVEAKIQELVNQIKDALSSVEEDEADFKNVANALHGLFNSLKESKADKSEMSQLRNQLITAQLNGNDGPTSNEGILDYRGLRKILSAYSKTNDINKRFENMAEKDLTFQRLDHSEHMIEKILMAFDELWTAIMNKQSSVDAGDRTQSLPAIKDNCTTIIDVKQDHAALNAITDTADLSELSGLARMKSYTPDKEINKKGAQRIAYRLSRPSTASSPLKEAHYLAQGIRRGTSTGAPYRPHTSPAGPSRLRSMTNIRSHRKSVVPSCNNLPSIESKKFVQDDNGNLFVGKSENKSMIRESIELSTRRMSVMSFRDGRATST